jgi:hypothetical protein
MATEERKSQKIVLIVIKIAVPILFLSLLVTVFTSNNSNQNFASITTPAQNQTNLPSTTPTTSTINNTAKSLPEIVAEWQKSTAYVECYWVYPNVVPSKWYLKESGSGLLTNLNSTPTVITNRHVTNNSQYGLADECDIAFPNDNDVFYSITTINQPAHTEGNYSLPNIPIHGQIAFTSDGGDVAYLSNMQEENQNGDIAPSISLKNRARSDHFFCDNNPPTGEKIAVLGYPDYGTNAGEFMSVTETIDPTVTEGIIAGQDGIYLTTTAQIDPGNSGGLAIDEINDCYVGIPTSIEIGEAGTLGRILPASYAVH